MNATSIKNKIKTYAPTVTDIFRYIRSYIRQIPYFVKIGNINFFRTISRIRDQFFRVFSTEDDKSEVRKILCNNWVNYITDLHPKDRRMLLIKTNNVRGMGTENISFLINEITGVYACKGAYLEIGTFHGCSLLSAALFNPSTRCIGIDNFSQWDPQHNNENTLKKNLAKFYNPRNIKFYNINYKDAIKQLFSKEPNLLIDVYYYDGEHSYENQSEGLRIMLPHLSRKCVIIVDDVNLESVEQANKEFVTEHPEFKSVFKIKTEGNSSETWWNGFEVLEREF